jgi:hypothetical protein
MGSGSTRTVLGGDSLPDCHVSSESWLVAVATVDSGAWARGMASPLGSSQQGTRQPVYECDGAAGRDAAAPHGIQFFAGVRRRGRAVVSY